MQDFGKFELIVGEEESIPDYIVNVAFSSIKKTFNMKNGTLDSFVLQVFIPNEVNKDKPEIHNLHTLFMTQIADSDDDIRDAETLNSHDTNYDGGGDLIVYRSDNDSSYSSSDDNESSSFTAITITESEDEETETSDDNAEDDEDISSNSTVSTSCGSNTTDT